MRRSRAADTQVGMSDRVPRLQSILMWFLPESLRHAETDTLRRAKLCIGYNLMSAPWGPCFAIATAALGQWNLAALAGISGLAPFIPLFALRQTGSLNLAANLSAGLAAFFL